MTDVCQFDFNAARVAVFRRNRGVPPGQNGNWVAYRGSRQIIR